jgi:hypothetical protein
MEYLGGILLVLLLGFIAYKVKKAKDKVNTSGPLRGGRDDGPKTRIK